MSERRSRILGALLGAAGVLAAERAAAASRELRLPELVALSQEIVIGRVLKGRARWQGALILTSTVVRVDEALKGRPARKIKVTQLGGTAVHRRLGAAVTMTASSYTELRPGEQVVLFLEQKRPGRRGLVGAQQGKFVVREEAGTGRPLVPVAPKRLRVARGQARVSLGAETMTLDALRDDIRALVAGAAIRPAGGNAR